MRLESTKPAMVFLPLLAIAYAWFAQKRMHVTSLCTALFLIGFFTTYVNTHCRFDNTRIQMDIFEHGRIHRRFQSRPLLGTVVAMNSCFRGVAAFVFTEANVPLQELLGDGGLYTLWAGILVLCELVILPVRSCGGAWREAADEREKHQS
jgi:hypothetical protein